MLTRQTIPHEFKETLKRLHDNGFPEACIAGGALRDLDNGREVKDVDVFVHYRGPATLEKLEAAMGYTGSTLMGEESVNYVGSMADVKEIYDFRAPEETAFDVVGSNPPYQIIAVRDNMTFDDMIGRIDLGICQIGFNGDQLLKFPAYFTDQDDHTMTVIRCDNEDQMDRSIARIARLQEKYLGWTAVIPPSFQHFLLNQEKVCAA